ncbi:MAG: hypothetical protein NWF14_09700 [Candidatus Bathyarchaeota archaeon]|nr:hypothetical protein [Candidatus Bathyarchaeota archaeon]
MNKYVAGLILGLLLALMILGFYSFVLYFGVQTLSKHHNDLTDSWKNLVVACNATNIAFGWLDEPLKYKTVPSTDELRLWLLNDTTDEYEYSDTDFDCFHYSATLTLHGRARHYDMGLVAIYGYNVFTGERLFHCINAIVTSEGLVYIEPQLDEVWHFEGNSELTNGTSYDLPGLDYVYVEEVKIIFTYQ